MFDKSKISLGIAPIGWCNDDMPELGSKNTFRQIVSEMALAGFTGCEIGNKYPSDPIELKKELDVRGMRIASRWFSSFIISKSLEENIVDFNHALDFLSAVGANRINVSEQSHSIQGMMNTPILENNKYCMNDNEWKVFADGLNELGKIATNRSFKLCFHHHMGTVVQSLEETRKLMELTDPRYVYLCYDSGHFTFAGENPLTILEEYGDRLGHIHLKDVRNNILIQVKEDKLSFLEAVKQGAFTVPGDGNIDFPSIFKIISNTNYEGWFLVEAEQDPDIANPLEYAIMARKYILDKTGL